MEIGRRVAVNLPGQEGGEQSLGIIVDIARQSTSPRNLTVKLASGRLMNVLETQLSLIEKNSLTKSPSDTSDSAAFEDDEDDESSIEPEREMELPVQTISASEDSRLSQGDQETTQKPTQNSSQQKSSSHSKKPRMESQDEDGTDDAFEKENANDSNSRPGERDSKKLAPISEKPIMDDGLAAFLTKVNMIPLPQGAAGAVGQLLMNQNRPMNMTGIVQALKDTYTRAQIDKALTALVDKAIVSTIEDGAKLFWINQTLIEKSLSSTSCTKEQIEKWSAMLETEVKAKDAERQQLEHRVKALIVAPSDEELEKWIAAESALVKDLEGRLNEIKVLEAEAIKQGKDITLMNAESEAEMRHRLEFYLRHSKYRKRTVTDFVDTVCDAKGVRGAARRDLIETMGLEME